MAGSLIWAGWRPPPYRSLASHASDIPQPRNVCAGRGIIRPESAKANDGVNRMRARIHAVVLGLVSWQSFGFPMCGLRVVLRFRASATQLSEVIILLLHNRVFPACNLNP